MREVDKLCNKAKHSATQQPRTTGVDMNFVICKKHNKQCSN